MKNSIAHSRWLTVTLIILGAGCVVSLPVLIWNKVSGINRRNALQAGTPTVGALSRAARLSHH